MLTWMINIFRNLANWLLGRVEAMEQADQKVKDALSVEHKRVFWFGFSVSGAITLLMLFFGFLKL